MFIDARPPQCLHATPTDTLSSAGGRRWQIAGDEGAATGVLLSRGLVKLASPAAILCGELMVHVAFVIYHGLQQWNVLSARRVKACTRASAFGRRHCYSDRTSGLHAAMQNIVIEAVV